MAREIVVPANRRPSAPGELIRDYLRATLNAIVNGKRAVTLETAMRLERVLGASMQTRLNLQAALDIFDALHSPQAKHIAKLRPLRKPAA